MHGGFPLSRDEAYQPDVEPRFNFLAPILGWLIPGLGQWSIGYRRRGMYIGIGVIGLFLIGLLVGGLGVINRGEGFWWYCGQVLVGPATPAINYWNARHPPPDDPADDPGYVYATPSFARVNEAGTLYTTLAGLMNLLAMLDVVYRAPCRAGVPRASGTTSVRRKDDQT
jgi:hypothetical protein